MVVTVKHKKSLKIPKW